jgi:hypothetical protein
MGISSSKQKTTSNETNSQTGTTSPDNPEWVTNALSDYTGRIGSMLDSDPYSMVAPVAPLQQQAFDNTSRLGLWGANNNAASNIAIGAANMGASTVPGSNGYTAARGNASTYTAPTLANPREAQATGYGAAQAGPASMLDNLNAYFSPYKQQVVDSTLADFDHQAGQTRAAQAAEAARSGAFGGSRYGVREAQTEGELARARASTEAGLLDQGFTTAAGLSQSDAANRQQAGLFNADARNAASQFGAGAQNAASLANQGASNQFSLAQAGMDSDSARYAADSANNLNSNYLARADAAAQFGAGAANDMARFNAGQQEAGLGRQLQAASLLNGFGNDYAGNAQRDLALMSDLGGQQRNVEQALRLAPLAQLQAGGSLFGATPFQIFTGQNISSTGTSNGTSTTVSTPSLFSMLEQMSQNAANAYAAGGM